MIHSGDDREALLDDERPLGAEVIQAAGMGWCACG